MTLRENESHSRRIGTEVEIEMDILANTYSGDEEAVHSSTDMWNCISVLGGDIHRAILQVVNKKLEVEGISQDGNCIMSISYSRST